jgi:hypothetical protein
VKEKIVIILACFHVWRPLGKWFLVIVSELKRILYDTKEIVNPSVNIQKHSHLDNVMDAFNRLSFEQVNEDILIAHNTVPHYLHHPFFINEEPYFVKTTVTLMYNLSFTETEEMKDKMIRGGILSSFFVFLNMANKLGVQKHQISRARSSSPSELSTSTEVTSPSKSRSVRHHTRGREEKSQAQSQTPTHSSHTTSIDFELVRSVVAAIKRLTNNSILAVKTALDLGMVGPLVAMLKLTFKNIPGGVVGVLTALQTGLDRTTVDKVLQEKRDTVKNIISILPRKLQDKTRPDWLSSFTKP